jgi:hypothetical protein
MQHELVPSSCLLVDSCCTATLLRFCTKVLDQGAKANSTAAIQSITHAGWHHTSSRRHTHALTSDKIVYSFLGYTARLFCIILQCPDSKCSSHAWSSDALLGASITTHLTNLLTDMFFLRPGGLLRTALHPCNCPGHVHTWRVGWHTDFPIGNVACMYAKYCTMLAYNIEESHTNDQHGFKSRHKRSRINEGRSHGQVHIITLLVHL